MVVIVFCKFLEFITFKNKLTMTGDASRSSEGVRLAKFGNSSDFVVVSLEGHILLEVVLLVVALETVELLVVLTRLSRRTRRHKLRAKFLFSVLKKIDKN